MKAAVIAAAFKNAFELRSLLSDEADGHKTITSQAFRATQSGCPDTFTLKPLVVPPHHDEVRVNVDGRKQTAGVM